jgi:hypothetical protein
MSFCAAASRRRLAARWRGLLGRRPIRDHRRVEFERAVGRLPVAGRDESEQKSPDDRQSESVFLPGSTGMWFP